MTEASRRGLATALVLESSTSASALVSAETTVGAGFQAMLAVALRGLRHPGHRGETERPENVHRFRVGLRRLRSLISAFTADAAAITAQVGERALDDLLAAHRLWSDWLGCGRVRKLAFVAEKVDGTISGDPGIPGGGQLWSRR